MAAIWESDWWGDTFGGKKGSDQAAQLQGQATDQANQFLGNIYGQQQQMAQPYQDVGLSGLAGLSDLMSGKTDITQMPGYQFRLQQGLDASNASASARGGALGGAQLKALQRYGQDYASQEYGNQFNRLSQLAGIGQGMTGNMMNVAQNYGNTVSGNLTGLGNAQGAAAMAPGRNLSSILGMIGGAAAGAAIGKK